MKIGLLAHPDIASLSAHRRIIEALPGHEFTVFLSPASPPPTHPAMAELAAFDAGLCRQFYRSGVPEPLAPDRSRLLPKPNAPEGLDELRRLAPDLIISIRYRRILHEPAIAVPRLGVINLHSGILPDYRGVMATFWAMLHGAEEVGTTLHRIVDSGVDTGPVIGIDRLPLDPEATYLGNVLRLYPRACEGVAAVVRALANGTEPETRPQSPGGAYYSSPTLGDVEAFIERGLRLHDGGERQILDSSDPAGAASPRVRT